MSFFELIKIELMKIKRGKILLLIFIAPMLVVFSGIGGLKNYLTPEFTNAWAAMFIQSALVYSYYLLPFTMIVVSTLIFGREKSNNGILKMLALPLSRHRLSLAKFFVLVFFLIIELIVFLLVFVLAGIWATKNANIAETLPILYLLNWCIKIFLTMLPSLASIWAITIIFDKVILSVGLNILLVIPSILVAATPLRIVYPYCYSGYLVSCSLYDFTSTGINNNFELFPLMPIAIFILAFAILLAIIQFGKKEMR